VSVCLFVYHSFGQDSESRVETSFCSAHVTITKHAQKVLSHILNVCRCCCCCCHCVVVVVVATVVSVVVVVNKTLEGMQTQLALHSQTYLQESEANSMRHLLIGHAHVHQPRGFRYVMVDVAK
jgi:hypothetical protein